MISARRAALLGLDAPLSPIMLAVLGLWPEQEDETPVIVPEPARGSGGAVKRPKPDAEWTDPSDDDERRVMNNNQAIIATVVALVAAGVL